MSLSSMLAAHDEAVLIAMSSKGLARRAKRDVDAGKGVVNTRDEKLAELVMDGETVSLGEKGPAQASCTCPASGLCRHILASVILLRETSGRDAEATIATDKNNDSVTVTPDIEKPVAEASEPRETTPHILHVHDELLALTDTEIKKFAGVDLSPAVQFAASVNKTEITREGLNLTVSLEDSPAVVKFIAGQGLKGVIYKGPKTKARLIITAYVLLVRRDAGQGFEWEVTDASKTAHPLDGQTLQDMSEIIASSVRAVLTGVPEIAVDRLFEQAISARVQSAPRVTAELRGLAKLAKLAASHHIDYDPGAFLEASAKSYALCQALAANPSDVQLSGSLKRTYKAANPLELWMLGARTWRTSSGARGLTCYGLEPKTGVWFETTTARAAGMDLSFSAEQAYRGTLWRGGTPKSLMGKTVFIPEPQISDDYQISQTVTDPAQPSRTPLPFGEFKSCQNVMSNWAVMEDHIFDRLGSGLRRRSAPIPVLIKPETFQEISFDELGQRYKWRVCDSHGHTLDLNLPADNPDLAQHLRQAQKKIYAILVVARLDDHELHYEPVSLCLDYKTYLTVLNIGLDHVAYRRLIGKKSISIKNIFSRFSQPAASPHLRQTDKLLAALLDVLVDVISSPARVQTLRMYQKQCERAGLTILADALTLVLQNPTESQIVRATYILSETRHHMHTKGQRS